MKPNGLTQAKRMNGKDSDLKNIFPSISHFLVYK